MVADLKSENWAQKTIGHNIEQYNTDSLIRETPPQLILLSCGDSFNDEYIFKIRHRLYSLFVSSSAVSISDIGHFIENIDLLPEAIEKIKKYGSIPLIISSDQSITFQIYKAYCNLELTVNILSVDEKIDLGDGLEMLGNNNWLTHVLAYTPNFLFNYSVLGTQSYFCSPEMVNVLLNLNFDIHRLGNLRKSIQNIEPVFRNADIVSFDLSSIRNSDFQNSGKNSPNGLYAEESCQLLRYAGMSNKVSAVGVFGWDISYKSTDATGPSLIAQLLWHFIDGFLNRIPDGKIGNEEDYIIYKIGSEELSIDLIFYKNIKNGRWWMNVPINEHKKGKFERHHIVPCSIDDYKQAMSGDIPETWWQTYQKLL
jgi:arginase family enzyme